jgi:nucleoside transporter
MIERTFAGARFNLQPCRERSIGMFSGVRLRLCIMMFLEYAVWGIWGVSAGGYMYKTLHFDGAQVGAIFSTTAVGAMISPLFIGFIADRFFSTEKMLSVLHFLGAILLLAAAFAKEFGHLLTIMQVYALVFMPTLALTNSISFANIADSKRDFPGIRVWGTWGWIAAGLFIGFATLDQTNYQFIIAGVLSAILAIYCLYLPRTMPKSAAPAAETPAGATAAIAPAGESIFRLLRDPTFLVFVVCSLLICIPLSFYYSQAEAFLVELGAPYPPALMTVGQFSEVVFMSLMPFFIAWLGVKRMLTVGMMAWVLRYLAFASLALPIVIIGLILHGVCYDFYFVASYIYVDTRVNERQRASAQSFIAFVMLGVGMFIGSNASGWVVDRYPAEIQVKATVTKPGSPSVDKLVPLPDWNHITNTLHLQSDATIKPDMIPAEYTDTDPYLGTETHYDHASLVEAVTKADQSGDGAVTQSEWAIARRRQWPAIWLWPAAGALITCVIFVIGFRERVPVQGEEHVGFDAVAQTEP